MKNSNDTIGYRTRDLTACSAVPQPAAQPRAPTKEGSNPKLLIFSFNFPYTNEYNFTSLLIIPFLARFVFDE
jgi:hypothetical protein